jgi:hypothetical protein
MGRPAGGATPPVSAPDARLVNRRWLPVGVVDWVHEADAIMVEHGAVQGTIRHKYQSARWHARKLIGLMVELGLHERWELSEHVEKRGDGYLWSVEYFPGKETR